MGFNNTTIRFDIKPKAFSVCAVFDRKNGDLVTQKTPLFPYLDYIEITLTLRFV